MVYIVYVPTFLIFDMYGTMCILHSILSKIGTDDEIIIFHRCAFHQHDIDLLIAKWQKIKIGKSYFVGTRLMRLKFCGRPSETICALEKKSHTLKPNTTTIRISGKFSGLEKKLPTQTKKA